MKFLLLSLSLFSVTSEAAIPRRVDLTERNWCAPRRSEDRTDKFIFKKNGELALHTFHSTGDVEEIKSGSWKLVNNKLTISLGGRPTSLTASVSDLDWGRQLTLSSGVKATSCD